MIWADPCPCTPSVDCPEQPRGPCLMNAPNSYILRMAITGEHGALTFIGNTLGLSKALCMNEPGLSDSIGAFTTVDDSQMAGIFTSVTTGDGSPAGTTLSWQQNSSSAVLNIPTGSTILYAELVWSGSYGYYCSDSTMTGIGFGVDPNCVLNFANGPITLITPDNQVHSIVADPATAMISQNPAPDVQPFYCAGNYTRSANVTALFTAPSLANPNGTYIVGGVPATVSATDDTHNAAGWTLAIMYRNPASNVNNMSIFVGSQQASRTDEPPAQVTGFCAEPPGPMGTSRLLVSAVEGDALKTGDTMQFGPTPLSLLPLFGPNNPIDNFFCSQINDDTGQLIDTTGTYCTYNAIPSVMDVPQGRQGYDITNVDCTWTILPNQMTAFALGTTVGDDYMINALGLQIMVFSPVIVPIKKVNGQDNIVSSIGDIVTFTATIMNSGATAADNVLFTDVLETGLLLQTLKVNNVVVPNPDLIAGVPLGTINIGDTVIVEYTALIASPPVSGNLFQNFASSSFEFFACSSAQPIQNSNDSNIVTIRLRSELMPGIANGNFKGKVKKCPFLDTTGRTLKATWTSVILPTVLYYEIFYAGKFVERIPSFGPFVFDTCLDSHQNPNKYTIVAVYPNNLQSLPTKITITHD